MQQYSPGLWDRDSIEHIEEFKLMLLSRIKRPRRVKKLPVVVSKEEVRSIIETTRNLKHRTIV
jgi:hypothetical protein